MFVPRTLILVPLLAMTAVLRPSGEEPAPGDGPIPWRIADATLEPLARPTAGGNTVLRVRFERGQAPPPRIVYDAGGTTAVLADDGTGLDARAGDGLYTALGSMDLEAFRRTLERLSRSRTAQPVSAFASRAFVPTDTRLDPAQFAPGKQLQWVLWGDPTSIDAGRSLLIRDPSVVQDPTRTRASCDQPSMGPWSFGYLMEQLANTPETGVTGAQLAESWLSTWLADQVVNGSTSEARPMMQELILDPWRLASGGPGAPLDLSIAPFRLQAIVNRIDLRKPLVFGSGGAGELRFVFNLITPTCEAERFQVIFEFAVPATGCMNLKAIAHQWKQLDQLPIGSPEYNAALEAITSQVVAAGANPAKANGSRLNQLRTNENHLDPVGGLDWQVREFRLDGEAHLLRQVTLKQTPKVSLRNTDTLGQFVEANAASIKAGTHTVPLTYLGSPFRAPSATYSAGKMWRGPANGPHYIDDRQARHRFAIQTCIGCHYNETPVNFTHVIPAAFGTTVALSPFMTGGFQADPVDLSPTRYFDDLQRRAVDLDALLSVQCFAAVIDEPLQASH